MGRLRWPRFAVGWLALCGAVFLSPWAFCFTDWLLALVAIVALPSAAAGPNRGARGVLGQVLSVAGAVILAGGATFVGLRCKKPGGQVFGVRAFGSDADALGQVFGDGLVAALAVVGATALAIGWRSARGVPWGQAAAGGVSCLVAYPLTVLALYYCM